MMQQPQFSNQLCLQDLIFLVVDANDFMRGILKNVLGAFGAELVIQAEDGTSALNELKLLPINIIFTDLLMDPVGGLDLTRHIRTSEDSSNPYMPIIVVSGHTEVDYVKQARDAGVNEFIAKPITAKAIYSRLNAVIQNRRNFVKTQTYFGPDRRRSKVIYRGKERRDKSNQASYLVGASHFSQL